MTFHFLKETIFHLHEYRSHENNFTHIYSHFILKSTKKNVPTHDLNFFSTFITIQFSFPISEIHKFNFTFVDILFIKMGVYVQF